MKMDSKGSTDAKTPPYSGDTAAGILPEQTSSNFLNLPAEIRNSIYQYAATDAPTYLNTSKPQEYLYHGFLGASQQTRKEFIPIYYSFHGIEIEVTNSCSSTEHAKKWLQVFAPVAFPWLHKFCASMWYVCGCKGVMAKHSIYVTFKQAGDIESTPAAEQHMLSQELYDCEFQTCTMMRESQQGIYGFMRAQMEDKEEVRFTRQDFEAFVGEVGRLMGHPMRLFPLRRVMEQFDLNAFWESAEAPLEHGHGINLTGLDEDNIIEEPSAPRMRYTEALRYHNSSRGRMSRRFGESINLRPRAYSE